MMQFFSGNALWQLVRQSDTVSWLVLFTLLIMSIACWTIFLYKIMSIRIKNRQLDEAGQRLLSVKSTEELLAVHAQYAKTAPGHFLIKMLKHAEWFLEFNALRSQQGLTQDQAETIESQSFQLVDDMVQQEESCMSFISTSAAVSPLLGLFGTVWGLIQAFIAIGEKQAADIAAVAPGIAQALTTTLAGLLVAIPAFVMYNYLSSQTRLFEQKLVDFSSTVQLLMQRLLVR